MRRGTIRALPFALVVLACAGPARASTGGPTLLDVLGWSPTERRVYVHVVPTKEGGGFGDVLYFALDGPDPERPMHVPGLGGGEGTRRDARLLSRLAALRERLVPLQAEMAAVFPVLTTVVSADTMRDCFDAVRYRVRARWSGMGEFEFECTDRTDVAVKSILRVPGRNVLLLVVTYFGDCYEGGGYEIQEPVLLADPAVKTRYVPWRGTG